MRIFFFTFCFFFLFTGCDDTGSEGGNVSETDKPNTSLSPAESQQLSYNNLLQRLLGSTEIASNERYRFLMLDKKRSLLHFFSTQKKDQEYTLGATYQTCIQVGNIRQSAFDKICNDLYDDEYSRLDQLLRTILENPRHDEDNTGELEFYFQHFSMSNSVIFGTDKDLFGLELYLAFLRMTQADEELIKEFEDKKNGLIGL